MKSLILQHESITPPGSTLQWLDERGIPYDLIQTSEVKSWPQVQDYDLLFICGGNMNVDQEDRFPWLKEEKKLIRKFIDQNKFVVGLCLGSQLIADVLGAEVKRHDTPEVGWHPVELIDGSHVVVFQWHEYTFSIPKGAELIATGSHCRNQGFQLGSRVMAFQFHPETTVEWAIACANDPLLPTEGVVQTKEEILRDLPCQKPLQEWYFKRLDHLIANS